MGIGWEWSRSRMGQLLYESRPKRNVKTWLGGRAGALNYSEK